MSKRRSRGEGSIWFSKTENCWIAEIVLPDGRKKRKRSKKQQVVREWLQVSVNALKQGAPVLDDRITVSEYLDRFMADVAAHTLKPKTIDSYKLLIEKHIKPAIGNLKLTQVRPSHLQTLYSRKLEEGLSKRSVQYIHAVIRRSFNQAVRWEFLARNPASAVTPPKPIKRAPEILSVDQIKKFFEAVKDHRYYPIYLIAVGCGLREGEILGLERKDVSLDEGILQVRQTVVSIRGRLSLGEPKTDKAKRAVAIPGFVADVLKDHLKKDGLLFATSTGKPVSPRNLLRHFHLSLARAGIPRVKFHSLRHSYATIQLISGTNPKIVQEALGHSTITLTLDTYSHIIPTLQKEAAENINKVFKP